MSDLIVPAGAPLPVVLLDSARPLTAEQAAIVDETAERFVNEVAAAPARGRIAEPEADTWGDARMRADERYRLLFGYDAANAEGIRAAREALPRFVR